MLKVAGAVIIMISCCFYGWQLSRNAEKSMYITEALVSFVMYVKATIKMSRTPLPNIYSDFTNKTLADCGFLEKLNNEGTHEAFRLLDNYLNKESRAAMQFFEKNIGGIDIDNQIHLCDYVADKLSGELEKMKSNYNEKRRMYRLLPILAGLSVIILAV